MEKAVVFWSGGKDCAMALERVLGDARYQVAALLTTTNATRDRVMMHGVRRSLIESQAQALNLPLRTVELPEFPANEVYEAAVREALLKLRAGCNQRHLRRSFSARRARPTAKRKLSALDMCGVFPLWGESTRYLAEEFVRRGYRGVVACVDTVALSADFCGRVMDERFFHSLPAGVDPCGENGEFHSFVTHSPLFSRPVAVSVGERVQRDRFAYCDLVAVEEMAPSTDH